MAKKKAEGLILRFWGYSASAVDSEILLKPALQYLRIGRVSFLCFGVEPRGDGESLFDGFYSVDKFGIDERNKGVLIVRYVLNV